RRGEAGPAPVGPAVAAGANGGSRRRSVGTKPCWGAAMLSLGRRDVSAHLGQERELARVRLAVLVGEFGGIVAGEAMIRELRRTRFAPLDTQRAINAGNGEEGEARTTREGAHLLDAHVGSQQLGGAG